MAWVSIRFYAELNDFLPPAQRARRIQASYPEGCTVKALIEDLGVPHTEVDLILANGESVGFSYRLAPEDELSVYPVFEALDISGVTRLRPRPLRVPRFAADVHLGKLARLLRLFGFDTLYRSDWDDEALVRVCRAEGRTALSRDRGLLKRRLLTHGYCVRSTRPALQIREVVERFDLRGATALFTRCLECNAALVRISAETARPLVPPAISEMYGLFSRCPSCRRVFWRGTHWERLMGLARTVLGDDHPGPGEETRSGA
jgi:uncharacterized protein